MSIAASHRPYCENNLPPAPQPNVPAQTPKTILADPYVAEHVVRVWESFRSSVTPLKAFGGKLTEDKENLIFTRNHEFFRFRPLVAINLKPATIQSYSSQPTVFITPELTNPILEACRANGASCADLKGRLLLHLPKTTLEREVQEPESNNGQTYPPQTSAHHLPFTDPFLINNVSELRLTLRFNVFLQPFLGGRLQEMHDGIYFTRNQTICKFQGIPGLTIDPQHLENGLYQNGFYRYLLITVKLTDAVLETAHRLQLSCIDISGRAIIQLPHKTLEREAVPPIKQTPQHPEQSVLISAPTVPPSYYIKTPKNIDIYHGKSSRILALLLQNPKLIWSLPKLQREAGISKGLTFRVMDYLRSHHLVTGGAANWQVTRPNALLTHWATNDRLNLRIKLTRYLTNTPDELETLAVRLHTQSRAGELAFTQWQGARLRMKTGHLQIVSFYSNALLDIPTCATLSLRKVRYGGNVWLFQPNPSCGIRAHQTANGLPTVSDALIYLDLKRASDIIMPTTTDEQQRLIQSAAEHAEAFAQWANLISNSG